MLSSAYDMFPEPDLLFVSGLVNLKTLRLGNDDQEKINQGIYNHFSGSLTLLANLTKLENRGIENTDLDSGLEYLPESIQWFGCSAKKRKDAKVKAIGQELRKHGEPSYSNFSNLLSTWKAGSNKILTRTEDIQ